MDIALAKVLVNIVEESGEQASIYDRYSGRGMYGDTTTGIVIDHLLYLTMALITQAHLLVDENGDAIFVDIEQLRCDNLGKQFILY